MTGRAVCQVFASAAAVCALRAALLQRSSRAKTTLTQPKTQQPPLQNNKQTKNNSQQIRFGLQTPQDIMRCGVLHVHERALYKMPERAPHAGGVLDRRLGISSKTAVCETCRLKLADCAGHFGYIRLELPVFHIGYFKNTLQVLQCICKTCSNLLLPDEERRKWSRCGCCCCCVFAFLRAGCCVCVCVCVCVLGRRAGAVGWVHVAARLSLCVPLLRANAPTSSTQRQQKHAEQQPSNATTPTPTTTFNPPNDRRQQVPQPAPRARPARGDVPPRQRHLQAPAHVPALRRAQRRRQEGRRRAQDRPRGLRQERRRGGGAAVVDARGGGVQRRARRALGARRGRPAPAARAGAARGDPGGRAGEGTWGLVVVVGGGV